MKEILEKIEKLSDSAEDLFLKAKLYNEIEDDTNTMLCIVKALSSSNEHYYELTELKIKCLMRQKKYIECLKILEEELSMPYIPKEYESSYLNLYKSINNLFKDNSSNNKFKDLDEDQIKDLLLTSSDYGILEIVLDKLSSSNIRNYLDAIEKYLSDPSKDNYIKTNLLYLLNTQKIDKEIKVFKNDLSFSLIPSCLKDINDLEAFKQISKLLDKLNSNFNITIEEITKSYLASYISYIYPLDIDEDEYIYIAISIYLVANSTMNIDISKDELIKSYSLSKPVLDEYISLIEKMYIL